LKTSGAHGVLCAALAPLKGRVRVAFIYGSIAAQKDRADSDIDLMILGDASFDEVVQALSGAEKMLRREINPSVYPPREFRSKLRSGSHFLNSVLQSRKLFVLGTEDDLRELSPKRLANQPSEQPRRNQEPAGRGRHKTFRL
jgi:predicted nucleotidyltransferase